MQSELVEISKGRKKLFGWVLFLALVLFSSTCQVYSESLSAVPSVIAFDGMDPSKDSIYLLPGGVTVSMGNQKGGFGPERQIHIMVEQPLTDAVTGRVLPNSRIRLGVDSLKSLDGLGPMVIAGGENNYIVLRVGLKLERFDYPGTYVGQIWLADYRANSDRESLSEPIRVPIRVEVTQWVAMRPAYSSVVLNSTRTEENITTGERPVVYVGSNGPWRLAVTMNSDLVSVTSRGDVFPHEAVSLKVRATESVNPIFPGFAELGNRPLLLAWGNATKDSTDGWIPINVEFRILSGRDRAAGTYHGIVDLVLEVDRDG